LRAGKIRCVVATNALELGIDIGMLDAVVCAGYPGSIASLWQRFGRSGRRGEPSLALLVASSAPLDQYFAAEPNTLIGAPVEHARIDPDNVEILVQHLKCAAFELPFEEGESFGDVPASSVADALGFLAQHKVVHPVTNARGRTTFHWSSDTYPANHVSLRSVGWDNVVIIDVESHLTLAEMDWRSSHTMLHEQAIYQHAGEQYQVEKLDYDNHKAYVRKVEPDYYTTAMTNTAITVIDPGEKGDTAGGVACGLGDVSVVEKVVGFKKIKFHTHENTGYGEVTLPEMQMHTTAVWLTVPPEALAAAQAPRPELVDALHGIANALHTVAVVSLMIDPRDLGRTVGSATGDAGPVRAGDPDYDPTIFLYDHFPGGVGLAPRLYDDRDALLSRARRLIDGCACAQGCPACVGPIIGEGIGKKALAARLLGLMGVAA
jgi:DEAD/DEAH box helicase domain-containing protein